MNPGIWRTRGPRETADRVNATTEQAVAPPVTQKREFWVLVGYAVVLGVFGAFAGLIFVGAITSGGKWYSDSHPGWLGGHWWWVAVAAAAGATVGLVRRLSRLPWKTPGLFDDLQTEHVDAALVPGIAAVSAMSLIGGASLGPEKALGSMGGGAGSWIAQRRGLKAEDAQVNTLAGFAGAYGGLFSSTCSWATSRCRSTGWRTGSYSPVSPSACSRP